MTSSLPDYSSSPVNSPATDTSPLTLPFPAGGSATGIDSGPVPGFDTLMGASAGPVPGPAPQSPVGIIPGANSPTRMISNPAPVASAVVVPVPAASEAPVATGPVVAHATPAPKRVPLNATSVRKSQPRQLEPDVAPPNPYLKKESK